MGVAPPCPGGSVEEIVCSHQKPVETAHSMEARWDSTGLERVIEGCSRWAFEGNSMGTCSRGFDGASHRGPGLYSLASTSIDSCFLTRSGGDADLYFIFRASGRTFSRPSPAARAHRAAYRRTRSTCAADDALASLAEMG